MNMIQSSNPIPEPPETTVPGNIAHYSKETAVMHDQAGWIYNHCKITTGGSTIPVNFLLNQEQRVLMMIIKTLRAWGWPVRIIILKARQIGFSTFGLGYGYYRTVTRPHHHFKMVTHEADASETLFKRVRLFHSEDHERLTTDYSSRREIQFSQPHHGLLTVDTAGKDNLGRSQTIHDLHCSEMAFWPGAGESLTSALQCVNGIDTSVFIESTANGLGGEFFDMWGAAAPYSLMLSDDPAIQAVYDRGMMLPKGLLEHGCYIAYFVPWHGHHAYTAADKQVPADFECFENHEMYGEERSIAKRDSLNPNQVVWRRDRIRNYCRKSSDVFRQEYPGTDQEAFLVSGRPAFEPKAVINLIENSRQPLRTGWFEFDDEGQPRFIDDIQGKVEIWEEPKNTWEYALGADTAEGLQPDESRNPDANSAHVIRANSPAVVAKLNCQLDADQFARQIYLMGLWYNQCLLAFEANNTSGGTVRQVLKHLEYPNLFMRERWDEDAEKITLKIGFYTDRTTRGPLIDSLVECIRSRKLLMPCLATAVQLQTFVKNKAGKREAAPGKHDDDVISLAIAWLMIQDVIKSREPSNQPKSTGQIIQQGSDTQFQPEHIIGGVEDQKEKNRLLKQFIARQKDRGNLF